MYERVIEDLEIFGPIKYWLDIGHGAPRRVVSRTVAGMPGADLKSVAHHGRYGGVNNEACEKCVENALIDNGSRFRVRLSVVPTRWQEQA